MASGRLKTLKEMNNRELFCVLTGDRGVVQQAMLQNMIRDYKARHPERVGTIGEIDLSAIVAEMADEG